MPPSVPAVDGLRTADLVDAMGRMHRHRCAVLDLVSPAPDRVLFGPAVTVSYFPSCAEALPPERFNFARLFYEALEGERVWEVPWPKADPALLETETITLVVQVNGKRRDQIEASADAPEDELLRLARESEQVRRQIDGKEVVKEIVVPGRLINLVVE